MGRNGLALPVQEMERPAWKTILNWTAAIIIAILFLASGLWKATDPTGWAVKLAQAKFPQSLSVAGAIVLGILETTAGVLILSPRFRRWGAWLSAFLLAAFMVYVGYFYKDLSGQDCSCFPWLKRAVNPMFFVEDGIMLALAVLAGLWAQKVERKLGAILVLAAVSVFSLVSYGVAAVKDTGIKAPDTILVDGKPYSLQSGKIFLYFFDPQCMHCLEAGRKMSAMNWGDTKFIGVAVTQPDFAAFFMQKSGLNRPLSSDWELLKKTFDVKGTPGAVALEDGHEKAQLTQFEDDEPGATLKKLGFVY
jgi:uncharacterized membrane protein YphA (DoxX/SURF4 family)